MGCLRRSIDGAFQTPLTLDSVCGLKAVSELAALQRFHPTQIAPWKKLLLDCAAGVFDSGVPGRSSGQEPASAEICEQIGRLAGFSSIWLQ